MAPEGVAGRPVSSAFPATVMPAPDASVSAPAAVKVDLAAPAPNWASPATSSLAPGAAVPRPALPAATDRAEPPTEKAVPWMVRVDCTTTLSPGAVSRTMVPSSLQPEAPEPTWLST